ncbi:DEAD/DEAH box helicase [Phormidium sp. CLA17]|uniref:DEAD/DEAH box helicase n=1 Tax=Leptolyngbya sp. Cla-17 TaxID=2803751 RepID=UPI0014920FBA|nr:DEAD/DEAH box helicase [Leptolyngbya sp. Cla-17]MBM0740754.1 DEAD/DEAH box helicase [Leptolyngbya sp. Cla-17]
MAILHGSWLLLPQQSDSNQDKFVPGQASCLIIWGEIWRKVTPQAAVPTEAAELAVVQPNPYGMTQLELMDFLKGLQKEHGIYLPALAPVAATLEPDPPKRTRKTAKSTPTIEAIAPNLHGATWQIQTVGLPTAVLEGDLAVPSSAVLLPQLSATSAGDLPLVVYPWHVGGLCLSATEALLFLNSLPLGYQQVEESFVSGDLRFWSHVARWSLDLLARAKFLPGLEKRNEGQTDFAVFAEWEPLLDSAVDQARLMLFGDRMPAACRMYEGQGAGAWRGDKKEKIEDKNDPTSHSQLPTPNSQFFLSLPPDPQVLLLDFLQSTLDAQIRQAAQTAGLPIPEKETTQTGAIAPVLEDWLHALSNSAAQLQTTAIEALETSLQIWTTPLQHRRAENLFRICLSLYPPSYGQSNWQLEYGLQAVDTPNFIVDAPTIWNNPVERLNVQGRMISQPQEIFLMGLGLASRLYAPIEPSLQAPRPQFCALSSMQAYEFLKSTAWRLQDSGLGVVVPPSLASQDGWANRLGLRIQAETAKLRKGQRLGLQSLLDFRWELTIGGQSISKEEFDRLVALNMPLVEINGEWVELRSQDIRNAQTFFASRKDQPALSLEDALRISTGDTQMIEKLPVVSFEAAGALEGLINTLSGNQAIADIETPASFQGELRPYQSRGVGWLSFLEQWSLGACLADDMGLGKTIQLIAFLLHLQEQNSLDAPTLLICPTSVLGNWEREVQKFAPSLKVLVHHGDSRPKGRDFARAVQEIDLVLSSYALVHRDIKDLQTVSWRGVVLDEAQNIKNPEAKQSQAVRQLSAQFRIAMTGTPVENRLSELWSILDFLNPGYLGPKNFFQRRFAAPIERYGDTASLQTLRSLVQPFILRRLKSDRTIIQDLPDKQETTIFCGLSSEQASLYQHWVEKSLSDIEAADGIQRKGIILALITKLKQICNHPDLFLKGATAEESEAVEGQDKTKNPDLASFQSRSGKLQRLEEMLEEVVAEGDRALIFTQFAEWGKLLKAHLEKQLGRETLFLYGSTSKKQREEMVDRFQLDPQAPRIFILSLKAGGVGLNLTRANHVFHFDRWWNPAVENQATDRVFRIGQKRKVQVHKFVCSGTLEEKIHAIIESKKALAEQVVGAGESWLTELNTDQLRDLLLLDRSAIIDE